MKTPEEILEFAKQMEADERHTMQRASRWGWSMASGAQQAYLNVIDFIEAKGECGEGAKRTAGDVQ